MAKQPKQKFRKNDEPMTINTIYDTVKSPEFLREIYYDLISDIAEKPTYKRLKNMVNSLINDAVDEYDVQPVDENEESRRRTAFSKLSILTHTIDTVISQVLLKKLEHGFRSIIAKALKELQDEMKNGQTSKSTSLLEDTGTYSNNKIENKSNTINNKGSTHNASSSHTAKTENHVEEKNDTNNKPRAKRGRPRQVRTEIQQTSPEKEIDLNAPSPKRIRRKKVFPDEDPAPAKILQSSSPAFTRKRGRPINSNKANKTEADQKGKTSAPNRVKVPDSPTIDRFDNMSDLDSDIESEISIGGLSDASVSSVHTSELSSFEDTISVDGFDDEEDTGGKKHVPLKLANDMYLHGKLSQIYEIGKKGEQIKNQLITQATKDSSLSENSQNGNSPVRKLLPQRIRKPNSKYNTETMYCEVKDYSTSKVDFVALNTKDKLDLARAQKRGRKRKVSKDEKHYEEVTPAESISKNINSSIHSPTKSSVVSPKNVSKPQSSPQKTPTKRNEPSNLYKKSKLNTGTSFGSRGNPAITLFSTH